MRSVTGEAHFERRESADLLANAVGYHSARLGSQYRRAPCKFGLLVNRCVSPNLRLER